MNFIVWKKKVLSEIKKRLAFISTELDIKGSVEALGETGDSLYTEWLLEITDEVIANSDISSSMRFISKMEAVYEDKVFGDIVENITITAELLGLLGMNISPHLLVGAAYMADIHLASDVKVKLLAAKIRDLLTKIDIELAIKTPTILSSSIVTGVVNEPEITIDAKVLLARRARISDYIGQRISEHAGRNINDLAYIPV